MFILLGAFQTLRNEKRIYGEMLDEIRTDDEAQDNNSDDQFYSDITIREMIKYGMLEEIAGHIRTVVNFRKPDLDSMKTIIRSKCESLAREYRCNACITDEGVEELMKLAYSNLGIRGIINSMAELTRGEYYRGSTFIKILEKIKSPGYAPGL